MNWVDYRERLGIGFNDKQKFQLLKNKINIFMYHLAKTLSYIDYRNDSFIEYFIMVGDNPKFQSITGVIESFDNTESMVELISKFVAFTNTIHRHLNNKAIISIIRQFLPNEMDNLHIKYITVKDEDGCFIFPKGANELDNALVSEPLEWLRDYPLAQRAWITALKDYSESTELTASETADNFRKALERFFQEFFQSEKSLENLKSEYGTFLTSKDVPGELRNNFEKLLESYTNYINNYAKHHDKASRNVLEYIMYQTGNLIRLLITLKQEDTTDAD